MIDKSQKIQQFILKNIPRYPQGIVSKAMDEFKVSRTTVLRHINHLVKQNKVSKSGKTKQVTYTLLSSLERQFVITPASHFDEFEFFTQNLSELIKTAVKPNVYDICEYVITEMLNNLKDHASASKGYVKLWFDSKNLYCVISDNGIGVFKSLEPITKLKDPRDIIFELSKGKLTRDPQNHTGEGLFFSSRAVDEFTITANRHQFYRNNFDSDWSLATVDDNCGTMVSFSIDRESERELKALFEAYTEGFNFTKTDILVDLSKRYGERLISRSQAKRVCKRISEFSDVTLDFKKVAIVGQGFVDQVFRVFQNEHPHINIHYVNANSDVEYMIKRGLSK